MMENLDITKLLLWLSAGATIIQTYYYLCEKKKKRIFWLCVFLIVFLLSLNYHLEFKKKIKKDIQTSAGYEEKISNKDTLSFFQLQNNKNNKFVTNSKYEKKQKNDTIPTPVLVLPKSRKIIADNDKFAIIDETLSLGRFYNWVTIEGENISLIRINARSKKGESIAIHYNSQRKRIEIDSYLEEPYIEIEFKNNYYSISVKSHKVKDGYYYPIFSIASIKDVTMQLRDVFSFENEFKEFNYE